MKQRIGWLKVCVWGLSGILVAVGASLLFTQSVQWISGGFLNFSRVSGDAFLLCCGLLYIGWVLVGFADHAISARTRETHLQSQVLIRPYLTSAFDCSVEHAIKGPHCFFAQVYGSVVSEAAAPESFRANGYVRNERKSEGGSEVYSAPEGKSLIAYRLENICAGAAVPLSLTINRQCLFQFQSLAANSHVTLYLLFDNLQLQVNECLLHITLRYQDAFSMGEYTQSETATVLQSFGQCPTVAQRMEDILSPPLLCDSHST